MPRCSPAGSNEARVAGYYPDRLSGLADFLPMARGCSVLDIGCNRGLVAFEFARYGARLVHGCDIYGEGIRTAAEIFKELDVVSRFETVDLDLAKGSSELEIAFGSQYEPTYDIVLYLGVHHHLRKKITLAELGALVRHLAGKAAQYFVCRAPSLDEVDQLVVSAGLARVHFSRLSHAVSSLAIWEKRHDESGS